MIEDQEHDTSSVIKEANTKFDSGDLPGAQMVYQTALLTWVDDASFGDNPIQVKHISEGVATLWIEFASLNRKAGMLKAATDAFEAGVNCPIAGSMGRVWGEYAKYQEDRERYKTAQKIYLRALVGENSGTPASVKNQDDQNELWNAYLRMMQTSKNDEGLSLDQLKEAVELEHKMNFQKEPILMDIVTSDIGVKGQIQEPIPKRPRHENMSLISSHMHLVPPEPIEQISAANVEASASVILDITRTMPPEITAEWLVMDGDSLPSRPEPPLFSPSPPKLGDVSGKDILGENLALKLIRLLIDETGGGKTCSTILDLCKGCWVMTALKEREAAKSVVALDKKLAEDIDKMESELEARLSVAGAALSAVEQVNANEKKEFISRCNQQRQQLQALISWEFRHLLIIQQHILTSAGVPTFKGPTVDSNTIHTQSCVCSYLHSSFNVKRQIGEEPHLKMLKSQEAKLSSQLSIPTSSGTLPPPPLPSQNFPPQQSIYQFS